MKLEQIEYFLATVECKSITAAARRLFISQPALSKQIHKLEDEVGVALFERLNDGIVPTPAGIALESDLRTITEDLATAVSRAKMIGQGRMEVMRVGCFESIYDQDYLPAFIEHIATLMPNTRIELNKAPFAQNEHALATGKLHVLITPDIRIWDDTYAMKKLVTRNFGIVYAERLVGKPRAKTSFADFSGKRLYVLADSANHQAIKEQGDIMRSLGMHDVEAQPVENMATLQSYLQLGYGYALLSPDIARNVGALDVLELPKRFSVDVVAIWKKSERFINALLSDS